MLLILVEMSFHVLKWLTGVETIKFRNKRFPLILLFVRQRRFVLCMKERPSKSQKSFAFGVCKMSNASLQIGSLEVSTSPHCQRLYKSIIWKASKRVTWSSITYIILPLWSTVAESSIHGKRHVSWFHHRIFIYNGD